MTKISFSSLGKNVESSLGFKPDASVFNGLCLGHIESVEVEENLVPAQSEDGTPSGWEFAGKKLYQLTIKFRQVNNDPKDTAVRLLTIRETIVSSKDKNGEYIKAKTWGSLLQEQYKRLQHIVNALDNAKIAPLSKDIPDIEMDFEASPEVRIASMKKFFEHFATQIKGKGEKARYEGVTFWMRVVASKEGNYFTLPAFVGKGFIEVYDKAKRPTIELATNDSIVLTKKADKKESAPKDMNYRDADAAPEVHASADPNEVLRKMGLMD